MLTATDGLLRDKRCQRVRALARTLHARMFLADDGRIWLVRGVPEAHKLMAALAHARGVANNQCQLTPTELGYAVRWDGELTVDLRARIAEALNAWDELLRHRPDDFSQPAGRQRRAYETRIAKERAEVARLRQRLAICDGALAHCYLLDDTQKQFLQVELQTYDLPRFEQRLARLVLWLAGKQALRRFCKAAHTLAKDHAEKFASHHLVAAALVVLATYDGAVTDLPLPMFKQALASGDADYVEEAVIELISLAGRRGYEPLLRLLGSVTDIVPLRNLFDVQQMLARGVNPQDVAWMVQEGLLDWMEDACLAPASVRELAGKLTRRRITPFPLLRKVLLNAHGQREATYILRGFAWLDLLTPATATPRFAQQLTAGLRQVLIPMIGRYKMYEAVRAWLQACEVTPAANPLQTWLMRIANCQKLIGLEPAVPKSVRKHTERQAVEQRELVFLDNLVQQRTATAAQVKRYQYLQSVTGARHVKDSVVRAAEEAFIVIAFETLRKLLERNTDRMWREFSAMAGRSVPSSWKEGFASWIMAMTPAQWLLHAHILKTWRSAGANYKRQLDCNQAWLQEPPGRIDVSDWLRSSPVQLTLAGQVVEIRFADDPREVFLMGTYFGSCLSWGQCNQMSVLANAAHANKQVVYMYGQRKGRRAALARMLVVIGEDSALLRYQVYVADHVSEELRDACEAALTEYAARRARRAGIALANDGKPGTFCNHFWYDDGALDWPDSARLAWDSEPQQECWSMLVGLEVSTPEMALALRA